MLFSALRWCSRYWIIRHQQGLTITPRKDILLLALIIITISELSALISVQSFVELQTDSRSCHHRGTAGFESRLHYSVNISLSALVELDRKWILSQNFCEILCEYIERLSGNAYNCFQIPVYIPILYTTKLRRSARHKFRFSWQSLFLSSEGLKRMLLKCLRSSHSPLPPLLSQRRNNVEFNFFCINTFAGWKYFWCHFLLWRRITGARRKHFLDSLHSFYDDAMYFFDVVK